MDVDALVSVSATATALVVTACALYFGAGLMAIIVLRGVAWLPALWIASIMARRLDMTVKAPQRVLVRELFQNGMPFAASALVIATQPFVEIMMLSAFAGVAAVGWYGASRVVFGLVMSPVFIIISATFPQFSRASLATSSLRDLFDATARVLFIAAAAASSSLYVFADHIVAILYGESRLTEAAHILRFNAISVPLLYFVMLLASTMWAVGRSKEMVVISIVRIAVCVILNWLLIGYWHQHYGNGAIALVIIGGLAEIPAVAACLILLPKGSIAGSVFLNALRSCFVAFGTVAALSLVQPRGLLTLIPMYALVFVTVAMATRLVLASDLWLAFGMLRDRSWTRIETRARPDG